MSTAPSPATACGAERPLWRNVVRTAVNREVLGPVSVRVMTSDACAGLSEASARHPPGRGVHETETVTRAESRTVASASRSGSYSVMVRGIPGTTAAGTRTSPAERMRTRDTRGPRETVTVDPFMTLTMPGEGRAAEED